ncbi:hypothetical protein P154DRAFT_517812 [Amniculicola lignicola CBS 123094]|uniref:BTB domain-containing protein n=1 Tax=Amniculicola lignicola CBS 123094 TaxID=1392246 RepID=A0A6A5X2W7_9PLEO|nr:hypothetical protein P154DRAFT_517812 [Amniculicola lignicola CBS 123094]
MSPPLSPCTGPSTRPPSKCFNPTNLIHLKATDTKLAQTKTFSFPLGLLTWHSSYYAKTLCTAGSLWSSGGQEMKMEEDLEAMEMFNCFVYTNSVLESNGHTIKDGEEVLPTDMALIKAFSLATKLGMTGMRNSLIDVIHRKLGDDWARPKSDVHAFAYENTAPGSQLRRLLVDFYRWTSNLKSFWALDWGRFPKEFLTELLEARSEKGDLKWRSIGKEGWQKSDRCRWHDHSGPGGQLCAG